MAKQKYYVVWKGRKTGVFDNWEMCQAQIAGFPQAVFKSFENKLLAHKAFTESPAKYMTKAGEKPEVSDLLKKSVGKPNPASIAVDGAWNTKTGDCEYQGVHVQSGKVLFRQGPFEDGTNNIVEFLGIVHALAYCKQNNLSVPIYSDSKTAISWVKNKVAKTEHSRSPRNKELFEMMDRGIQWLKANTYSNPILKWETKVWGENPADFGRK
jgi:ribonuclease HI